MGDLLTDLAGWVADVVHAFGYIGVFVLIVLGDLRLPIPTELTLPLAGFLVGQGHLSFIPVLLTATTARVTASLILYTLGLRISGKRLRQLITRFGFLFASELDKASEVFERHGRKAVVIGHLVPGVGALISVPAGLKRMPMRWQFLGSTVLGATLWTGTLVSLGWAFGSRWRKAELYASFIGYAVLVVVVVGVLWLLWRRWKTYR